MKRMLLAAGIGLTIITMSMSSGTHHFISSANEDAKNYLMLMLLQRDAKTETSNPKDTMHRPRPDTMQVVQ